MTSETEESEPPTGALYPSSETEDALGSFAHASLGSQVILLMAEVLTPDTAGMYVVTLALAITEVHPLPSSQSPITARTAISM